MKNGKRLSALLLTLLLVFTALQLPAAAEEATAISAASPAIGADVGDTVDLSAYTYGGTALDEFTWTPVNGGTLDGAEFEAAEKGVYVFDGVKGDESFRLFIVVKAADETEYVLYENTFDDESALDDLTVVEGAESALSIADGKLSIKGTSVRVLLPELYADFGNYKIDVEATLQNPSDSSRWMSIMFRATPSGLYYPYYQMAIRSNATAANGVEFARRTPANAWDVAYTSAYKEAIDPNKFYKFTVCAYDGYVSESINDELLIYGREVTDASASRRTTARWSSTASKSRCRTTSPTALRRSRRWSTCVISTPTSRPRRRWSPSSRPRPTTTASRPTNRRQPFSASTTRAK
mgnify:CR=1 FL=1